VSAAPGRLTTDLAELGGFSDFFGCLGSEDDQALTMLADRARGAE